MAQILIQNATRTYSLAGQDIHAVRNVSLAVEQGEFVSIVGHSGSGKTTLLSLIGGIILPTSGSIYFVGKDLSLLDSNALSDYRNTKIGFMFQFASLLPMLTVRENLLLPTAFGPDSGSRREAGRICDSLIGMVGLTDKTNAYPAQLSGGQQRRVAIARAFMNAPAVILADEPTGDLDEETEEEMMNFFKTMNRSEGTTFIMVTHNTELAAKAGRRIRMHQGAVLREDEG